MIINGKVHCFFEQSGTFKNEFIKMGIPAEDYDIQNNFGETDHVEDLFKAIEDAYDGKPSLFDQIRGGQDTDLILAFFPCIYFSDMSQILLTWGAYPGRDKKSASDAILERSRNRQRFYELCIKMITWAKVNNVRLIMENPLGKHSFLQRDFITAPKVVDMDRSLRGDYFAKPTAYWFINCDPTDGFTFQQIHSPIRVKKDVRSKSPKGVCSEERSMISPDYARNFICDFVLGKSQPDIDPQLF